MRKILYGIISIAIIGVVIVGMILWTKAPAADEIYKYVQGVLKNNTFTTVSGYDTSWKYRKTETETADIINYTSSIDWDEVGSVKKFAFTGSVGIESGVPLAEVNTYQLKTLDAKINLAKDDIGGYWMLSETTNNTVIPADVSKTKEVVSDVADFFTAGKAIYFSNMQNNTVRSSVEDTFNVRTDMLAMIGNKNYLDLKADFETFNTENFSTDPALIQKKEIIANYENNIYILTYRLRNGSLTEEFTVKTKNNNVISMEYSSVNTETKENIFCGLTFRYGIKLNFEVFTQIQIDTYFEE